nr:hypothetical protein CKG001_10370 [Bdellovibrio sp. CKG001]
MSVRQHGCEQQRLKKLVDSTGKSIEDVASEVGISHGLLKRLLSGNYAFVVKEENRSAICEYFGVPEDVLFPFVAANE